MPSKSKGKLTHVSDFISLKGRLTVTKNGVVIKDARKIIYPGSGGDDNWWNIKQLLEQVDEAFNIFEEKHPNKTAVFVFDQSSAHASHGDGALNAFTMNASEGGAAIPQRDTYYPPECTKKRLIGQVQQLNWERERTVGKGKKKKTIIELVPKGIKMILAERGCLPISQKLPAKCSPKCANSLTYPPKSTNTPCCLARILANHEDFFRQKSALEELLLSR
ncbi:hypothetical protein DL98DRAFT_621037, partial [Cadophora sp. DSE1049]